jgi:hypothetical protein
MKQAVQGADVVWKSRLAEVIHVMCETTKFYTADDVEEGMERYDETTSDKRAMGAMFQRAAKDGWCVQTDRFVNSRQKEKPLLSEEDLAISSLETKVLAYFSTIQHSAVRS